MIRLALLPDRIQLLSRMAEIILTDIEEKPGELPVLGIP